MRNQPWREESGMACASRLGPSLALQSVATDPGECRCGAKPVEWAQSGGSWGTVTILGEGAFRGPREAVACHRLLHGPIGPRPGPAGGAAARY
jgi:hypothetical protein